MSPLGYVRDLQMFSSFYYYLIFRFCLVAFYGFTTKFRLRKEEVDQVPKTKAPLFLLFFLACIPRKKENVNEGGGTVPIVPPPIMPSSPMHNSL